MKLSSYFQKLQLIVGYQFLNKKYFLAPNLYLFNLERKDLPAARRILFDLNHQEFMHLGDHLFFIPLIKSFLDAGYPVDTTVTPAMFSFFQRLGLPVLANPINYKNYDLIISRFELIPQLSHHKALLVHLSQNITMPICSQLLATFSHYFNRTFDSRMDYVSFKSSEILTKLQLPQNKKLVLFNPYCDASSYLVNNHKKAQLFEWVGPYSAQPDYAIVLTGTSQEKAKDNSKYPFEFFDLRGKTDVIDIFELVNDPHVETYIGFDAFIMHVFSLFSKKSFVKFRGRITKNQSRSLSQYHTRLFSDHDFVTLI